VRRSAAFRQAVAIGRRAADRWGVEASGVARFGGYNNRAACRW
jgi:hypothetical protein